MKNLLIVSGVIIVILGTVVLFVNKKPPTNLNSENNNTTENIKIKNNSIFKDMTDMCTTLTKEQVSQFLDKPIIKTTTLTSNTLHSCQYYLNENQAVIINNDYLNVEKQKQGHEFLGRKIITNPKIPMENFEVIQENGLINEIYLILGPDNYVSINRTSTKTLSEEEVITFAEKLANVIIGKTPLLKSSISIPTVTKSVPLPQETDIVRNFFQLIEEKKPSDAVSMMTVANDPQKQGWAVQFNAITSMKVLNIESSIPEEWTDNQHTYKVTMNVKMNPDSANQPIPYYGWDNGQNIRWITLEKVNNLWKIKGIGTGP